MKLLKDKIDSEMNMTDSIKLIDTIKNVITEYNVDSVIETGTYHGLGSTRMIASCFDKNPKSFITIETNWVSWNEACKNLKKYDFVTPLWGISIDKNEAEKFIIEDVLNENKRSNDLFIDNLADPIKFYKNEINGKLGGNIYLQGEFKNPLKILKKYYDKLFNYSGSGLLNKYLNKFKNNKPLVLLDSAGGVGYMEFILFKNILKDNEAILILDDIMHLKHNRSYEEIKISSKFNIINIDENEGWLVAKYN